MGNNKKGLVHVQAWLNPNVPEDKMVIDMINRYRAQGVTPRALMSKAFTALNEKITTGFVHDLGSDEMNMLKRIMDNVGALTSTVSNLMVGGGVVQANDEQSESSEATYGDDTLNHLVSEAKEYN
jgi:hypothetical protein